MDFGKLLKMVDILHRNRIDSVHFQTFFNNLSSSEAFQAECQKALEALMAREMFEEAQIFAQSTGLELAGITLRQVKIVLWAFVHVHVTESNMLKN